MQGFKTRQNFGSEDAYAEYVRDNLKDDMAVICCKAYEDIKTGDIGKVIKVDSFDIHELNVHTDWLEKNASYWVRFCNVHILGYMKSDNIKLGDWVKVRHDVAEPKFKWGDVERRSVGIVTAISNERTSFTANFPEQDNWKGYLPEMEKVPPLHPSTRCNVCKQFPVSGSRFRCMTCPDFSLCNRCFRKDKSHMHEFNMIEFFGARPVKAGKPGLPFVIGDYVRVKASVSKPKYDWGKITDRRSIGKVKAVAADYLIADFSKQKSWKQNMGDLEIVPIVHASHTCDGCKLDPIGGNRYHCLECDDFDYCEDCFTEKKDHKHRFYRTKVPGGTDKEVVGLPRNAVKLDLKRSDSDPADALGELLWFLMKEHTGMTDPGKVMSGSGGPSTQRLPKMPTNTGGKGQCSYFTICKLFKDTLNLDKAYFDYPYDQCFCTACHKKRRDKPSYERGDPPQSYGLPIGWCKFGLRPPARAQSLKVFDNWHVGFHGTTNGCVQLILETGELLIPGDFTPAGKQLPIPTNHWDPDNPDMLPPEGHDVKQLYLSPSIKYSGCNVYAPPCQFRHMGKEYDARVAFQVRVKPDQYDVGEQTIGEVEQIDPLFDNSCLEWSTKCRGVVILTGLLVRVEGFGSGTGQAQGGRKVQD